MQKSTPISIMVQFSPICEENLLLFTAKTALLSQPSLCSGKYSLFLHYFSFVCPGHIISSYSSPPSSSHQSACHQWPLTITPCSILNCVTEFWVGLVVFFFFFSTLYSCYLPGRTMQKLIISMPWCSNFLSSVGWIIELCLFYYWEVHESPCDWYPLSITILGQNIAAELSGKGEITLRQRWGHSASLSAGFAAKSALKKDRKRQWKISKFCRGKS